METQKQVLFVFSYLICLIQLLHRESHIIFSPKRPILFHACATCSELPSNVGSNTDAMKMKTMKLRHDKLIYVSHPFLPCYCDFTWIKLTMSSYWGNLSNIRTQDVGVQSAASTGMCKSFPSCITDITLPLSSDLSASLRALVNSLRLSPHNNILTFHKVTNITFILKLQIFIIIN